MLLLVRERLLAGQQGGRENNAAAMNDALHTLMNPPPLTDAAPLADLVRTLVWQQRREARSATPKSSGALSVPPQQNEPVRSEGAFKSRSNEELATSLGTSVATIMQHLKNASLNGNIDAPHNVWEALLDINNVGKDLLSRDGE